MYPRSNDIRQFYKVMTHAESNDMEDLLVERANKKTSPAREVYVFLLQLEIGMA